MKELSASIWSEALNIRRSKIFWITVIAFAFIPLMLGLLMYVQINPDMSEKVGLIGTKASMLKIGDPGWVSYFALIDQAIAALSMLGIGMVISWVFGREFSDHTIKDIVSLPVQRSTIVASKFLVSFVWSVILGMVFFFVSVLIGILIGIPDRSAAIIVQGLTDFAVIFALTLLVSTPVAFFACYGKGFLVPIGFVIFTLIIANFTGLAGLGPYFPWAIPGVYSAPDGMEGLNLVPASYVILLATSMAGLVATLAWWRYADINA